MDFATRLAAYRRDRFQDHSGGVCIAADVFRWPGDHDDGPPVILIHEAPGLSESTLDVADHLRAAGFRPILPAFLTPPAGGPSRRRMVGGMVRMCIAAEFGALARGGSTPVGAWLRALARDEAQRVDRPVGVVGMCFSGGFALAAALEPTVAAAVMSQPALPFSHADDLGMTSRDLGRLQAKVGAGGCLRVLRYAADWKSPRARYDRLRATFPEIEAVEIPTTDRSRHSVLRDGLRAAEDSDLRAALDGTIAFLHRHLAADAPPATAERAP